MNEPVRTAGRNLQISNSKEEGVWLHFQTKDGKHAAINLQLYFAPGKLISRVIRQWAEEHRAETPDGEKALLYPTKTATEQHEVRGDSDVDANNE